jgi:hypothetical protein
VGDDGRPGVAGGQCLAQLGDVGLDVLRGARRRPIAPKPVDQFARADRPVGAQREHREKRSLLASLDRERSAVNDRIDAAEHAYLYSHSDYW